MVGSYEESILRGRMSTTPSKPLDFLAQIGVLGLGAKCKPSLRCPAHVTLPFSAVFYSYATTSYGRSKAEDGPSPYVGMVDLENGLPNSGSDQRSKRKAMMPSRRTASRGRQAGEEMKSAVDTGSTQETGRQSEGNPNGDEIVMEDVHVERLDLSDAEASKSTTATSRSHKRRAHGPKAPPGGSYRIPEQGQLQIIIKNQNKTAVKLFLIPYDLTGMEPGTKTFIRQRSYSAGPIIDNLPATSDSASDRPILRYLIHLHICCPSRGRYYLYKSIRVVFANRVPDGKEKLRNELSFPEPLYSPYKPIRVMHPPAGAAGGSGYHHVGGSGPGAALAAEKAYRRRSSGFSFSAHGVSQAFDAFGIQHPPVPAIPPQSALPKSAVSSRSWSNQGTVGPPSFGQAESSTIGGRLFSGFAEPLGSPSAAPPGIGSSTGLKQTNGKVHDANTSKGGSVRSSAPTSIATSPMLPLYKKLSKGDIGYGGNAFVSGSPAAAEGLLSQRLRSLEVEKNSVPEEASKETAPSDI